MAYHLKLFITAFISFLAIDLVWLVVVARGFYKKHLGGLLKQDVNWYAAISFYILFMIGLIVFVIQPALEKQSWQHAVIYGGLFGFMTYATYDLTNLATLKDWPVIVTFVDIIWGSVLASSICAITYFVAKGLNF